MQLMCAASYFTPSFEEPEIAFAWQARSCAGQVPEALLVTEPQDPVNFTSFDPKEYHDKMLGVKGRATSKGRGRGKGDERPGLAPFGVGRGRGKGDGELDGLLNGGLPRSKSHPSSLKDEDDEAYAEGLVGRAVSCLPAMDSADTKPSLAELVDSDDGSVACWFYRDPKNSVQVKDAAALCRFALQLNCASPQGSLPITCVGTAGSVYENQAPWVA